jgi:hypothetical protein
VASGEGDRRITGIKTSLLRHGRTHHALTPGLVRLRLGTRGKSSRSRNATCETSYKGNPEQVTHVKFVSIHVCTGYFPSIESRSGPLAYSPFVHTPGM